MCKVSKIVQDVQDDLTKVRKLDGKVSNLKHDYDRLREQAMSITAQISGMPRSSDVSDKIGNVIALLDEFQKKIDRAESEFKAHRDYVVERLSHLPHDECMALFYYYVMYWSVPQIAEELHCSRATVYNLFTRGKQKLFHLDSKR